MTGREASEWGQTGVSRIPGTLGCTIEPPAAAAYAVLPVGVDTIRPGNESESRKWLKTTSKFIAFVYNCEDTKIYTFIKMHYLISHYSSLSTKDYHLSYCAQKTYHLPARRWSSDHCSKRRDSTMIEHFHGQWLIRLAPEQKGLSHTDTRNSELMIKPYPQVGSPLQLFQTVTWRVQEVKEALVNTVTTVKWTLR